MTLSKRFNLISMMLLLLSFSLGCAKKRTNVRTEAQATSGVRENPGVSSGAASVVSDTGKKQADAVAAANGITVDWVTTDQPLKGTSSDGRDFIYVTNVFKINGTSYELPTVHYLQNAAPINSETSYLTANGVDFDLDGQCYDVNCQEYLVSVKISKESQNIQQIMLYVDFLKKVSPVINVNDESHFMTLDQFAAILTNYFQGK